MHTAINLRPRLPASYLSFIPRPQNFTEPRRSSKPVFPAGFPVTHLPPFANSVTALSWSPKFCSQGSEPPSYPSAHPFSLCLMYSGKRGWSCSGLSKEARTLNFRPFLGPSSCRKQIQGRQILPSKTEEGMGQRWAFSRGSYPSHFQTPGSAKPKNYFKKNNVEVLRTLVH